MLPADNIDADQSDSDSGHDPMYQQGQNDAPSSPISPEVSQEVGTSDRRKRQVKSVVWDHATLENGNTVKCKHCPKVWVNLGGSTSIPLKHIREMHYVFFQILSTGPIEPSPADNIDADQSDSDPGHDPMYQQGQNDAPGTPKLIKEEAEEGAVGGTTFCAAIRPATTASHSGAANVVDMEAVDFSDTDNEMTDKDIKKVWQKAKREYDLFEETDDYIIPSNPASPDPSTRPSTLEVGEGTPYSHSGNSSPNSRSSTPVLEGPDILEAPPPSPPPSPPPPPVDEEAPFRKFKASRFPDGSN